MLTMQYIGDSKVRFSDGRVVSVQVYGSDGIGVTQPGDPGRITRTARAGGVLVWDYSSREYDRRPVVPVPPALDEATPHQWIPVSIDRKKHGVPDYGSTHRYTGNPRLYRHSSGRTFLLPPEDAPDA